jgi:hypothetical protein
LKERPGCTVRFQPVEEIGDFTFPGMERAPGYSSAINRNFLQTLGIDQIPVLMAKDGEGIRILKGEGPISSYLDLYCPADRPAGETGSSTQTRSVVPMQNDGSCTVLEDCEDGMSQQPAATR